MDNQKEDNEIIEKQNIREYFEHKTNGFFSNIKIKIIKTLPGIYPCTKQGEIYADRTFKNPCNKRFRFYF
jgi:hypothetical protein